MAHQGHCIATRMTHLVTPGTLQAKTPMGGQIQTEPLTSFFTSLKISNPYDKVPL
jgi:hypothetical protein